MPKPTKKQLEDLSDQIKQDHAKSSPAEKRLKINMPFKKAVQKIVSTPPSKRK